MPDATITIGDTVRYDQHVAGPIYYTVLGFRPTDLGFLVRLLDRNGREAGYRPLHCLTVVPEGEAA